MTTLAIALKDEVRRLARKEIKAQVGGTARVVAQHRREIAGLKRQLREYGKKIAFLEAQGRKSLYSNVAVKDLNEDARFSARSAKAQRQRTGLSASNYAKLIGVSPLTIYNWEHNKTRPRKEQFAALVALRGLGKREAKAKLSLFEASNRKSTSTHRRPKSKK